MQTLDNSYIIEGNWASKIPVKLTAISSIVFLSIGLIGAVYTNYAFLENRQKISYVSNISQMGERLGKLAPAAREGNDYAFKELVEVTNTVNSTLSILKNGGAMADNITITEIDEKEHMEKVLGDWRKSERYAKAMLENKSEILVLKRLFDQSMANTALLEQGLNNLQKNIERTGDSSEGAQEMYILYQRIIIGMNKMFVGTAYTPEVGYNLVKDIKTLDAIIQANKSGLAIYGFNPIRTADSREDLRRVEIAFVPFKELVVQLVPSLEKIESAKVLSINLIQNADYLTNATNNLVKALESKGSGLSLLNYLVYAMFLLSLAGAVLFACHFLDKDKRITEDLNSLKKSQNNQRLIDMLKEQLMPMSRRDFTHKVFIADSFVSQIAERIDKIRLTFSEIVRQMKRSSFNIAQNADNTDNSSKKLVEVSDLQNKQMEESIMQIGQLTNKIDEAAQGTWYAQRKSLEAAKASKEGGELVKKTIEKMNDIRENIQESSKKIKKSSESAQAISVITEMIKNFTKKIEVLSLNAAIQASSTGEAGREFRVVATEVRRLAVESRESTSDILKLVQEVQQDIAAAVSSMEITTQEVVEGAKLTEAAGISLIKTENLSAQVAEDISKTTKELEEKSEEMATMSLNMQELQKTTEKAKEIIQVTVKQVESLNRISKELTETVAEYKIDNQDVM